MTFQPLSPREIRIEAAKFKRWRDERNRELALVAQPYNDKIDINAEKGFSSARSVDQVMKANITRYSSGKK